MSEIEDKMKIIPFRFISVFVMVLSLIVCTSHDSEQPDTLDNKKGFERHFGFPAPESVSDLYYFADEWLVDEMYQLGFTADQKTIEKIISNLGLKQGEPGLTVGLAYEFPWWDEADIENLTPYWKSNQDEDYYWYLWYNPESQRAYYIEFSL